MMDAEVREFIKSEIRKQINVILSGQSGSNTQFSEDIANMYPGMPTISARPVVHPYGFVSRAPNGTFQVTARVGDHSANRIILGHRDVNRPSLNQGEVIMYDQYGHQIYLSEGKMQFGSANSAENMVLGQVFKTMMDTLLAAIANHTHIGNLGYETSPPTNSEDFNNIQSSPIDDEKILSQKCFTEA
jgi:phage gp45-like